MPDLLLVTKVSLPILWRILIPGEIALTQISKGIQDRHLLALVSALADYGKRPLSACR